MNDHLNECRITDSSAKFGAAQDHGPIPLAEYVRCLRSAGHTIIAGERDTFWRSGEAGALLRLPAIDKTPPKDGDLRRVMAAGRVPLVSYILEPDAGHAANSLLYVFQNRQYCLETCAKNVRSDIRRALSSLEFTWMGQNDLLAHGFGAYRDARVRNGLTDGTQDAFERRYRAWLENPANHVLGAWRERSLIAFFTITAVDDWVEIGGHSERSGLQWRPNNGLLHCILDYYLTQGRSRVVNYGLSSLQENTNAAGLHDFKIRVGFEAIPVHRALVVHPVLRPLANAITVRLTRQLLRLSPGNRWLRKASGALKTIADSKSAQPA